LYHTYFNVVDNAIFCVSENLEKLVELHDVTVREEALQQLQGEHVTRHAVTIFQGQMQVLLMVGEAMAKRIRESYQQHLIQQQENDLILRLVLHSISTKMLGETESHFSCNPLCNDSVAEAQSQQRLSQKKKEKKKRNKKNRSKILSQPFCSREPRRERAQLSEIAEPTNNNTNIQNQLSPDSWNEPKVDQQHSQMQLQWDSQKESQLLSSMGWGAADLNAASLSMSDEDDNDNEWKGMEELLSKSRSSLIQMKQEREKHRMQLVIRFNRMSFGENRGTERVRL